MSVVIKQDVSHTNDSGFVDLSLSRLVKLVIILPTLMYFAVSVILMGIAVLLVGYALWEVWTAVHSESGLVMDKLLDAIGVVVISLALFDVAKYLLEEEVLRKRHPLKPLEEIRLTLAKFMSIIAIAVCLEALVFIFRAGKTNVETLFYPTLLLFSGVMVVLGLGTYLKISGKGATPDPGDVEQQHD